MQPFSRETIIDRRQSALRWSAILAGAAIAVGAWLVLQLFGTGVALAALDADDLEGARHAGTGMAVWSVIAAAASLGLGGFVAARLAGHHDRFVAGTHAVLAWSLAALVGSLAISQTVSRMVPHGEAAMTPADPGARQMIERALDPINAQLRVEGKPQLESDDIIEAARESAQADGYDRERFTTILDERTALARPEVERVVRQLDARGNDVVGTAFRLGEHHAASIRDAERAGCGFLVMAIALALGLSAAIGGALLATRHMIRRRGYDADEVRPHTTAPYPVQPPPPAD